jgi:hypothetical protein
MGNPSMTQVISTLCKNFFEIQSKLTVLRSLYHQYNSYGQI